MLARFMSCRERFRLKYLLGLESPDRWNHRLGYGTMWHVCEEALAKESDWLGALVNHMVDMIQRYRLQEEEIHKWFSVCCVQFPEYIKYWAEHPDVKNRTPLMQEQAFDVSYNLPSGRVVRLRGKWDSVDLIDGGIYLQENKTKGDIDKLQVERQLKFDLQTMFYLTALHAHQVQPNQYRLGGEGLPRATPILGVRYNVVRRPLSGGKGSIRPHSAKSTKNTFTPAETDEHFYERLRKDYIAAEPDYWFFRVRAEISLRDVEMFRHTCLDPLLETVCAWYEEMTGGEPLHSYGFPPMNYRTPFGVYSALEEGGATEYDLYMETGSEATLRRVHELFPELK